MTTLKRQSRSWGFVVTPAAAGVLLRLGGHWDVTPATAGVVLLAMKGRG